MSDVRERVEHALTDILPRMVTDGGGTHIINVEDGVVTLQLVGNCQLCPSRARSARALRQGITTRVPGVTVRVFNTDAKGHQEEL